MIKFCKTCGTKMNKTIQPLGLYDEDTGKREVILKFTCPRSRFWSWGHYAFAVNTYTHLKRIGEMED